MIAFPRTYTQTYLFMSLWWSIIKNTRHTEEDDDDGSLHEQNMHLERLEAIPAKHQLSPCRRPLYEAEFFPL